MENDIPKSNILNIEIYMDKHAKGNSRLRC